MTSLDSDAVVHPNSHEMEEQDSIHSSQQCSLNGANNDDTLITLPEDSTEHCESNETVGEALDEARAYSDESSPVDEPGHNDAESQLEEQLTFNSENDARSQGSNIGSGHEEHDCELGGNCSRVSGSASYNGHVGNDSHVSQDQRSTDSGGSQRPELDESGSDDDPDDDDQPSLPATSCNTSTTENGIEPPPSMLPPPYYAPQIRPRVWESDRHASECRRCGRRFNFLIRRHHCRRCGQVVCDRCSTHRIRLPVEEIVEDPMVSSSQYPIIAMSLQRVCDACIRLPIKIGKSYPRYTPGGAQPFVMRRTDSQQSMMTDCPVCACTFIGMRKEDQERHLENCLNSGTSPVRPPPRYLVYVLSESSPQVGDECPICFEEFAINDKVARLVCLCSYHSHCLRSWLERGKGCPVHYESNFGS